MEPFFFLHGITRPALQTHAGFVCVYKVKEDSRIFAPEEYLEVPKLSSFLAKAESVILEGQMDDLSQRASPCKAEFYSEVCLAGTYCLVINAEIFTKC